MASTFRRLKNTKKALATKIIGSPIKENKFYCWPSSILSMAFWVLSQNSLKNGLIDEKTSLLTSGIFCNTG